MKLPNGENAIVDIRKLRDYCLNPDSPRGSHKARVFASALGLTDADSEELREMLLQAAQTEEVILGEVDIYGQRYTPDVEITTGIGTAWIRSEWIILHEEVNPRLTTCYVLKRK